MLNYARDAGDGRRRVTIVSGLAGRPTAAIWRHVRGGNYVIARRRRRGGALAYEAQQQYTKLEQEGQHPLTGQRTANFRLLANQ